MRRYKSVLFLSVFTLILLSNCQKKDIAVEPEDPLNKPPALNEINVIGIGSNTATINCNKANDADNDKLYYDLFLEDSLVLSGSENGIFYKFENLQSNTLYNGKITVTDSINETVALTFSFRTLKYITKFDRLYHSLEGRIGGGHSIVLTSDGGYIVLSTIYLYVYRYLYLLKIDSLGYEQWSKSLNIKCFMLKGNMIETSQKNYVFVSDSNLVKIDNQGEIIWHHQEAYGNNYFSVTETPENELVVAGVARGKASLTKLTLSGEKKWRKTYSAGYTNIVQSICLTHDNNYAILGTERDEEEYNFWLLKVNRDGAVVWEKVYNFPDTDFAEQLILTNDNGFLITGHTMGIRNIVEARILKTDEFGELTWDKSFRWDSFSTRAKCVVQTHDGNYVFGGGNGYDRMECILVKLSTSGELIWKNTFKPENDLDYMWMAGSIKQTPDNGLVVTGGKGSVWGNAKEVGLWVFKTDELGNFD